MRHSISHITVLLAAASLLITGCQGKVDPEFVSSTTTGLQVKDEVIFEYDPMTWQTAFNRDRCEFRVHTDNMSDYYCLSLDIVPTSVGQKAKGDIIWTSHSTLISKKGLTFTVEKLDRSGRIWLWCRKEGIGATVQALE